MCILCVTTTRRFTVIRIVADDNDALVGALGSELARGTSGECVAVGTRRVRCDVWTSRVQGHHRQVPTGVGRYVCNDVSYYEELKMTEQVLIYNYVIKSHHNVNLHIIYTLIFKLHSPELRHIYIDIVLSSKGFRLIAWAKEIQAPPLATPPSNRNCASNIQSRNPAFPGKPLLHVHHKYLFLLSMLRIRACPDACYRH